MMTPEQDENYNTLFSKIEDRIGKPLNENAVRATIESFGIRAIDIQEDYGFASISDLATKLYTQLNSLNFENLASDFQNSEMDIPVSGYQRLKVKLFFKHYSLGMLHLTPILLQIFSIIFFGYSLWTYLGFNILQSTAVVLGLVLGLVITGGFVQVIGRQASFFWYSEDYDMVRKTIIDVIRLGIKGILFVLFCITVVNFFIRLYPYKFLLIVFVYTSLIGILLLVLAPMHVIKKRWVISITVIVGTSIAVFLKLYTPISIYVTHWIGISIVIILSLLFLTLYFKKLIPQKDLSVAKRAPKRPAIVYRNYKYFLYGSCVYIFVFLDRILAWSSSIHTQLPYVIYYEKNYEIGMDIAILMFFLLAGVLEYSIASFSRFLDITQKNNKAQQYQHFNTTLYKMYLRHLTALLLTSCIIGIGIYYIVNSPYGYEAKFGEPLSFVSKKVCYIATVGYTFFTVGMLNTLYLFTLNQPTPSLKAIAWASLCNLFIGFILSRSIAYEYSVIGMLIGALVFAVLTSIATIKFFKKIDYYYYASN